MYNNDSKTASISKSYTNSKKEELLKVINEAKQKLENVSYTAGYSRDNGPFMFVWIVFKYISNCHAPFFTPSSEKETLLTYFNLRKFVKLCFYLRPETLFFLVFLNILIHETSIHFFRK